MDPVTHTSHDHPADHIARAKSLTDLNDGLHAIANHMIPDLAIAARVLSDSVSIEAVERGLELARELHDQISEAVSRERRRLHNSYDDFHARDSGAEPGPGGMSPGDFIRDLVGSLESVGVGVTVIDLGVEDGAAVETAEQPADWRPLGEDVTTHSMTRFYTHDDDSRQCAFHNRLGKWVTDNGHDVNPNSEQTFRLDRECLRAHPEKEL